jgi:signal transduction histidine kinase/ActR/RegA family two-component response regulator
MNTEDSYSAFVATRRRQFGFRTGGSLFFATIIAAALHSYWPFVWLAVFLAGQIAEYALDGLITRRSAEPDLRLRNLSIAFAGFNGFLYAYGAAVTWFGGPLMQIFGVILVCGGSLANTLNFQDEPKVVGACLIGQTPIALALPLLVAVENPAQFLPALLVSGAWLLHFATSFGLVQKSMATRQALRAAKAQAQAHEAQARAATASKSTFVATLSHEIRNPLNAVTAAARLLAATELTPAQREYVSILLNGGDVLLSLINDVLDMSKIEAGKIEIQMDDVEVTSIAEKVRGLWSPKAAEKGIELDVRVDPDLPVYIRCDPLRLTQILFNLVSNAVKFTAEGRVDVLIGALEDDADPAAPPRLCCEVMDTGPGMSVEVLSRLFKNFEQADGGVARQFGGTGLGLAISRRLAELMGGGIEVESAVGVGSLFRLTLPLILAETPVIASSTAARAQNHANRRFSLLVAEDHPVNRRLIALFLEPVGWSLTMVQDGHEAVLAATERRFDLIMMDMQMPIMTGLEAAWAIRAGDGPNRTTPIIALTADVMDGQRTAWLDAGAAAFLSKPIDPDIMIETLGRLAQQTAAAPTQDAI